MKEFIANGPGGQMNTTRVGNERGNGPTQADYEALKAKIDRLTPVRFDPEDVAAEVKAQVAGVVAKMAAQIETLEVRKAEREAEGMTIHSASVPDNWSDYDLNAAIDGKRPDGQGSDAAQRGDDWDGYDLNAAIDGGDQS